MKAWVKYIFVSLFLLILVGGKSYEFSLSSFSKIFSSKKVIEKKAEENNLYSVSEQLIIIDDTLLELDEDDYNCSDHFSNFSFESTLYNSQSFITPFQFIWKKIEFRNKQLLSLQSKIYILIRNIRI